MKKLIAALAFISVSFFSSAQIVVKVDYDKDFDFTGFKNFIVTPGTFINTNKDIPKDHSTGQRKIEETFIKYLTEKGLEKAVSADTNFVVTFTAGAKKKKEIEGIHNPGWAGYGYHYAPGWGAPVYNNWWVNEYKDGTLIIDVYDFKSRQLVWRAYCETEISNGNNEETLKKIVSRAFKKFPPKKK